MMKKKGRDNKTAVVVGSITDDVRIIDNLNPNFEAPKFIQVRAFI
jgi:hypothetical protein